MLLDSLHHRGCPLENRCGETLHLTVPGDALPSLLPFTLFRSASSQYSFNHTNFASLLLARYSNSQHPSNRSGRRPRLPLYRRLLRLCLPPHLETDQSSRNHPNRYREHGVRARDQDRDRDCGSNFHATRLYAYEFPCGVVARVQPVLRQ